MREILRFVTDSEPCPYLRDRRARLLYRMIPALEKAQYSRELDRGFRRFGIGVFRPVCESCAECVPLRLRIEALRPTRSQRRALIRSQDLDVEVGEPSFSDEKLDLYHRFHAQRTRARGWPTARLTESEYRETFVVNAAPTLEVQYRLEGTLVAVAYAGEADDALNAIYAYHDPDHARRSLGTLNVLRLCEEGRRRAKTFVYLGYRVKGCPSMEYKASFRPHEIRGEDGVWREGS
jgi:arginine-tRNA-protein transferase